jgi:hypothetical protein
VCRGEIPDKSSGYWRENPSRQIGHELHKVYHQEKAKVKFRRDLDRPFVWTRGSQEASSEIRGSGLSNSLDNENPKAIRFRDAAVQRKPRFRDMRNLD